MARILHCNNVCQLGGTLLFTLDVARIYPEFDHFIVYLHEGEDLELVDKINSYGIEIAYVSKITDKLVNEIDPALIIFNNTAGKNIELSPHNKTTIFVHHNPTWPLIPVDLDVFVSETIRNRYAGCINSCKRHVIIPPGIDTSGLSRIAASRSYDRKPTIGKMSNDNPRKFPVSAITIMQNVQDKIPECSFIIVGGNKYYINPPLKNLEMPPVGSKSAEEFYSSFDILIYKNCDDLVDSWCRVISEAMASGLPVVAENRGGPTEQIIDGETGFLCNSDDEFVNVLMKLAEDSKLRKYIGQKAAKHAQTNFDIKRFRTETIDVIFRGLVNVL